MADYAARVTGIILRTEERSGSKVQEDGSSRAWKMTNCKVLVGGEDICEVNIPDEKLLLVGPKGEAVDWLVSVGVSKGFLNIRLLGEWSAEHTAQSS